MQCKDTLMGFVGDSVNKTIVHFDLVYAKSIAVPWPHFMENVISAFNRDDVSIVALVMDKRGKIQPYLINFHTELIKKVPLPKFFDNKSRRITFFADTTISVCDSEPTLLDVPPACFQLNEDKPEWSESFKGKQRLLVDSSRRWVIGFSDKVLCPFPDDTKDYFVNTCITDKHSNKSFLLDIEGSSGYVTFMGNRYRKSYFGHNYRHFMPNGVNIDTTSSDKIWLRTELSDQSVIMSLLGGEYLVRSNETHLYFKGINTTDRQIKAIAATQPNPNTLVLINCCVKSTRAEKTSTPSQQRESTTPETRPLNHGYFTNAGTNKSRDGSIATRNTATKTTSSYGIETTIRYDFSTIQATSHKPGSLTTTEIEKPREESITTMNTALKTTSSHNNRTTIRNDLSTTRAISHEPELENGTDLSGEYVAIIVLLGVALLVILILVVMYVRRRQWKQQLTSTASGTTSESEHLQHGATNMYSTEPVNHAELNTTHGSEREPALVVNLPNNQVCPYVSNDAWSPSSATLSFSVTATPGIDSSTIKSMSGIFAQASEVKNLTTVKQHKSTSKVETISTNIPSGSVHSLNPRANRSESDPVSLSQLPIQILKRIWRHKIKKRKQAKQPKIVLS